MKISPATSIVIVAFMSACSRTALPTPEPVRSIADFEAVLVKAGVHYEVLDQGAPELPEGESQIWQIRGVEIFVYSFPGADASARAAAALSGVEGFSMLSGQELQIWEREDFLVVYPGSDGGTILLISGLLGDPETSQVVGPDEPYPPAIPAAQGLLADQLGLSPTVVRVIDYESTIWPDSCLGLPGEGEACDQIETPGWRVQLAVNDVRYTLHTDAIGEVIRSVDD